MRWAAWLLVACLGLWACGDGDGPVAAGGSGGENTGGTGGTEEQPGGSGGDDEQPGGSGGDDEQPGGSGGDDEQPGGSGGDEQPGGSGGDEQPGGSGGDEQPGGSGGDEQPGGSGGGDEQPGGSGGDDEEEPVAGCGNGVVEDGEECDGGPDCTVDCTRMGLDCSTAIPITLTDGSFSLVGNNRDRVPLHSAPLSCVLGGSQAGEAFYTFTSPDDARWTFRTLPMGIDTVLMVQSECDPGGPVLACHDGPSAEGDTVVVDLDAGESVTIIVDGWYGDGRSEGDFGLSGSSIPLLQQGDTCNPDAPLCVKGLVCNHHTQLCQPNSCGDGVRADDEVCDDGNNVAGDGCAPDCSAEELTCEAPGTFPIVDGHFRVTGSTADLPSRFARLACGGNNTVGEAIFALTPDVDTRWVIRTVAPTLFNSIVAVIETCATTGRSLACSNKSNSATNGGDEVSVDIRGGETVYVVIDGVGTSSGLYTVEGFATPIRHLGEPCAVGVLPGDCATGLACNVHTGTCQEPSCGDGVLQRGEQCDDANLANGDGCDSNCRVEGNTCEDAIPLVATGGFFRIHDDTSLRADDFSLSCADTVESPDAVYVFEAPQAGRWVFDLVAFDFNAVLAVRRDCDDVDRDCNERSLNGQGGPVEIDLGERETIYIIVDGRTIAGMFSQEGTFTLEGRRVEP